LGADGFSFTAKTAARNPGLLQSERIVSNAGQRKQAFFVLQKFYRDRQAHEPPLP